MTSTHTLALSLLLTGLAALPACAEPAGSAPKKLIQFGWDMQGPGQLAQNIEKMQAMPFDGITIRTNYSYTFYQKDVQEDAVAADIQTLKSIPWGRFTDNFFYVVTGLNVDWFDDEAWAEDGYLLKNIRHCARAAKQSGCAGILFDPEFIYWGTTPGPWKYETQPRRDEKTFTEMEAMARQRGAQYMNAIEKEFPNVRILTLFWASMSEFVKANREFDPENRANILKHNHYGLLPAFMIGMLEAADEGTTIIDGNEGSYYYNAASAYDNARRVILEEGQQLVPPDLQPKYREHVRVGHAIYSDYLCSTKDSHTSSTYLTPQERALWVEHNVYWALTKSDGYVWFYNEYINWRNGKNMPAELEAAIESARRKVAADEPLGFDITEITTRGWRAVVQAENRRIEPRTARVPRVGLQSTPPTIDGTLDDPAWKQAASLAAFQNYAVARLKELECATTTQMIYDDKALYIAFRCDEPEMAGLIGVSFEEEQRHGGSRVDVVLAADEKATAYYHIMVDCENKRWDSLTQAGSEVYGKDSSWTGVYETAVHKGDGHWTVEMAIPWATLGIAPPKPGTQLKGNLIRRTHRRSNSVQEFSSWSESRMARYVEAEHFGTLVFE